MVQVGEIVGGHYRIIQILVRGGFGETYLAEDTHLPDFPQRIVKQLIFSSPDPEAQAKAQKLFENEAKILNQLGSYPQIPQLFANFSEQGNFYLVQEYIEGHDLTEELIPGNPWNESQVIELLENILEVLVFIHQNQVIHRDIKPANLRRRNSDQKIVIIDFGAIKQTLHISASSGTIPPTICIGTPGYMPPEQQQGHPRLSSDIYAVGMVAIEALTGVLPDTIARDPNTLELLWKQNISVSSNLANILDKMVCYNFNDRYADATEALSALNCTVLSPMPKTALIPVPLSFSINKIFGRGLVVVVVVVVVWLIFLFSQSLFEPEPKPTPSPEGVF